MEMRTLIDRLFTQVFLLVVVAAAISFTAFAVYSASTTGFAIYQAYVVSPSWSSTQGSIVKSEARRGCGKSGSRYYLDVTYQYQVNGTIYTSNRVWFGNGYCDDKISTELLANKFQTANSRFVFYDPQNPTEAVLFRGTVDNGTIFGFLLMTAITAGALACGLKFVADLRRKESTIDMAALLRRREALDRSIRIKIEGRQREKQ